MAGIDWRVACAGLVAALVCGATHAAKVSDVRGTLHNLSVAGTGTVKADSETQICVFCHTPHAATAAATPLWNRRLSGATYTVYTSSSLDANAIQGSLDQPGGSSKLCLSCHDGTLAIGSVNVLNGQGSATQQGTQSISVSGTAAGGVMPGSTSTGFTRNLGIDLTNDHPISVSFTSALAARDGELQAVDASQKWPAGSGAVIGTRASGYHPLLPLEPTGSGATGQVQCATCHDPHVRETDPGKGNQKFLRLQRFQEAAPGATYDSANDIICLACHQKNGTAGSWAYSAHANPQVATQTYNTAAAETRQFPANQPVWKAACLNCHDTHTVPGARRLLREATDSASTPKSGGSPALEQVCYQCHTNSAASAITPNTTVPNIQSDFSLPRHMPVTSAEQQAGSEIHDIGGQFSDLFVDCNGPANKCGADFIEQRSKLGAGNLVNRHAECTDCHNPHRVVKFRAFTGNPAGSLAGTPDAAGTHSHNGTHSNIASGVLRGAWGVEPLYGSASFQDLPLSYQIKRGDPGVSVDTSAGAAYVTREYQICLKCHSDFSYADDNLYPNGNTRPLLGAPGTPSGISGRAAGSYTRYTNQAKEFQAPSVHRGEVSSVDSGAGSSYSSNNHRSWHPVLDVTGRGGILRGNNQRDLSANWEAPWNSSIAVGNQTMYCTDCHGSNASATSSVVPDGGEDGNPWGPHGSTNSFILKGSWDVFSGDGQSNTLCFKCHKQNIYAPSTQDGARTGFWIADQNKDGHTIHSARDKLKKIRCNWCHVAVPHGWKNKALLVNLNDVGPEAGQAPGSAVAVGYSNGPYYRNARLKVKTFARSGQWTKGSCGAIGVDSGEWMSNTCGENPP